MKRTRGTTDIAPRSTVSRSIGAGTRYSEYTDGGHSARGSSTNGGSTRGVHSEGGSTVNKSDHGSQSRMGSTKAESRADSKIAPSDKNSSIQDEKENRRKTQRPKLKAGFTLLEKVQNWQKKAKNSRSKFVCVNCFSKPVGQSSGAQKSVLCTKCYTKCDKEECFYCKVDFVFLDWFKPWLATTKVVQCVECIEKMSVWGKPKYCDTCKRQCAYNGKTCNRCTKGRKNHGEPVMCEMCCQECAFLTKDGVADSDEITHSLCQICTRKHKIQDKKRKRIAELSRDDLLMESTGIESDQDAYARYRELQDELASKTKLLQTSKKKTSELITASLEAGTSRRVQDCESMEQTLSAKREMLHSKRLELLRMEMRTLTGDKRSRLDDHQERGNHNTIQYNLERTRLRLICETDVLESENSILLKQLQTTDRFPPPWWAEDAQVLEDVDNMQAMMPPLEDVGLDASLASDGFLSDRELNDIHSIGDQVEVSEINCGNSIGESPNLGTVDAE